MFFTLKRNDSLPLPELPVHLGMTRRAQGLQPGTCCITSNMGRMQVDRIEEACTLGDPLRFVQYMTLLTAPSRLLFTCSG